MGTVIKYLLSEVGTENKYLFSKLVQ